MDAKKCPDCGHLMNYIPVQTGCDEKACHVEYRWVCYHCGKSVKE